MNLKTFTKTVLCFALFAVSAITAKAADHLAIVGDAVWGGWDLVKATAMVKSPNNPDVFMATVHLNAGKGFKFLTEREWGKLEYRSGASDVVLKSGIKYKLYASKGASEDGKFKVSESANYEIICDLARKTVEVKKVAYQAKEIRYAALWMIGDATAGDWDYNNGVLLSQDSGNPTCYTATVELKEGEFKFTTNKQWGYDHSVYIFRDVNDQNKIVFGGEDNKWRITEDGMYNVTVDVPTKTISIKQIDDPAGHKPQFGNDVILIGDATIAGWNLDNAIYLEYTGQAGRVFKTTTYLEAGKGFKFLSMLSYDDIDYRPASNTVLNPGVPGTFVPSLPSSTDTKFSVEKSGNYDIVCNMNNRTVVVTLSENQVLVNYPALWLIGSATSAGWNPGKAVELKRSEADPAVYTARVQLKKGEFKILTSKNVGFDQPTYYRDSTNEHRIVFGVDGDEVAKKDCKWTLSENAVGTYDVTVDIEAMTIFCDKVDMDESSVESTDKELILIGDATYSAWDLPKSIVMTPVGPTTFKAVTHLEAGKEFKFLTELAWKRYEYRAESLRKELQEGSMSMLVPYRYINDEDDKVHDFKFVVKESGNYEIVCDLYIPALIIRKVRYQDTPVTYSSLWIVGSATPGGWTIEKGIKMTQDENYPTKFTAKANLVPGELKFATNKFADFTQDFFFRGKDDYTAVLGGNDNKWNITEAGTYSVTIDVASKRVTITKPARNAPTGISTVDSSDEAPAEYFTLNGIKVTNPSSGIYIKRQGGKTTKVVMK